MRYATDPEKRADLAAELVSGEATVDELTEYDDITFVNDLLQPAYERGHFDDHEEVVYVDRTAVENYGLDAVQEAEHQELYDAWRSATVSDTKQQMYEAAQSVFSAPYRVGRKTAAAVTDGGARADTVARAGDGLVTPAKVAGYAGAIGVVAGWITGSPELSWGGIATYFTANAGWKAGEGLADEAERQSAEGMLDAIADDIGHYTVEAVSVPSAQHGI